MANLTGERVPDLVVENPQTDALGVMLGNGAGAFGAPSSIALDGHPLTPRIADFNGDGYPDTDQRVMVPYIASKLFILNAAI